MSSDISGRHRVIPRFSLVPEAATNLAALRREVKKRAKSTPARAIDNAIIRVWMADGLVSVKNDGEWMVTLLSAETIDWMDGEVRVLVDMIN
jgi:hypothetical protein